MKRSRSESPTDTQRVRVTKPRLGLAASRPARRGPSPPTSPPSPPPPPRKIPRPRLRPSLGARKWQPSFAWMFENTNQSGLTPRDLSPQRPPSLSAQTRKAPFDKYERFFLNDFRTFELYDAGATDPYNTGKAKNTLSNRVHPLLLRNWITPGPPMRGKEGRHWDLGDFEVYGAMLPILKLCSRFMTAFETCDWWDALFKGPRAPVDPARLPPGSDPKDTKWLWSFKRRPPHEKIADPPDWSIMDGELDLTFHAGVRPEKTIYSHGVTMYRGPNGNGNTTISLSWEGIAPLMPGFSPPLSDSERLMHTFWISVVLLHELAHAVAFVTKKTDRLGGLKIGTLYYEDEPMSEDGYSMTNSILGGHTDPSQGYYEGHLRERDFLGPKGFEILPHRPRRILCLVMKPWPTWQEIRTIGDPFEGGERSEFANQKYSPYNVLLKHSIPLTYQKFPISLAYAEDIQQDLFWDTKVDKYGADMVKVYERIFGRTVSGARDDWCLVENERHYSTLLDNLVDSSPTSSPTTGASRNPTSSSFPVISRPVSFDPPVLLESDYDKKRHRASRKIARAVKARIDQYNEFDKSVRMGAGNVVLQAKLEGIRNRQKKAEAEYNEFYKDNDTEIGDLLGSKLDLLEKEDPKDKSSDYAEEFESIFRPFGTPMPAARDTSQQAYGSGFKPFGTLSSGDAGTARQGYGQPSAMQYRPRQQGYFGQRQRGYESDNEPKFDEPEEDPEVDEPRQRQWEYQSDNEAEEEPGEETGEQPREEPYYGYDSDDSNVWE